MKLRSGEPAAEAEQQQRDLEQQADKQQQRRGKPREQPAAKPCCGGGSGKAARSSGGGGAAASQQLARSGKQDKDKRRHRGGTSLTAMTALGTVAVYAGVRGGIAAFHHARRHFLTRLLHDLAAALNALNATWWLDFGRCAFWHAWHAHGLAVLSPGWGAGGAAGGGRRVLPALLPCVVRGCTEGRR